MKFRNRLNLAVVQVSWLGNLLDAYALDAELVDSSEGGPVEETFSGDGIVAFAKKYLWLKKVRVNLKW